MLLRSHFHTLAVCRLPKAHRLYLLSSLCGPVRRVYPHNCVFIFHFRSLGLPLPVPLERAAQSAEMALSQAHLLSLGQPQLVDVVLQLQSQVAELTKMVLHLKSNSPPAQTTTTIATDPSQLTPAHPTEPATAALGPGPSSSSVPIGAPTPSAPINDSDFEVVQSRRQKKRKAKQPKSVLDAKKPQLADKANDNSMDVVYSSSSSSSSESESETESGTSGRAPPPILIRTKDAWSKIREMLADRDITPRRAVNSKDAVKIFLATVQEFRVFTGLLDAENFNYSTFQLPEDRDLQVVLRGVTESVKTEAVEAELKNKGFAVTLVHRMKSGGKIWPLVTVHLDPKSTRSKSIFDLKKINGLDIKVERKHKSKVLPQCRRCLKFNHTANYCTAPFVCSFCARNHATSACKSKERAEKKPLCANCKGEHRATYRGCPNAPKPKKDAAKVSSDPAPKLRPVSKLVDPATSYSRSMQPPPAPVAAPSAPTRQPPKPATPNPFSSFKLQLNTVFTALTEMAKSIDRFAEIYNDK